jgi:hypothetical protein
VLLEGKISSFIERVAQAHVKKIEEDFGVNSIFVEEHDNPVTQPIDPDDSIWHTHFDDTCSNEGNRAGKMLYSSIGKVHTFFYRLEFECINNVT